MNTNPRVFSFLALMVMLSMIVTTVNAQLNSVPAQKALRDIVARANIPQPEPPKPERAFITPYVSKPVAPADTRGLPLASLAEPYTGEPRQVFRLLPRPRGEQMVRTNRDYDPLVQLSPGGINMPLPSTNWEGISSTGLVPPDTDGQVGPDHYVQIVNSPGGAQVRVWDKTGTQLYDFGLENLWPTNDPCYEHAYGDPIVLYDQMADRWLLTQFALPDPPYYECMAISKTGTPTDNPNEWWLYSFRVHETKMNDYPKLGIWPDGYYMSVNQFYLGDSWDGAGVYVFDRAAMLNGDPAAFQYADLAGLNPNYGGLLPSNLMGDTLPPPGAPNYFMSVDMDWNGSDDVMHVFEFHTDWTNPLNSTFSLVSDIVVAPFDWNVCGSSFCIDQPDGAPQLDAITDGLMMHLWYRNFGDHESLVVNHTVNAGSDRAGIRWYEFRGGAVDTTLADATIHQQGTYAPDDAEHRWMGSVAMDRVGNVALGYSVSSVSVYSSIRYAGRQAGAPLGTLPEAEAEIIAGSGVQTYSIARWGDYSAMSVDPVDDCTFWYTQEYVETSGPRSWQTRVASFQFPSCSLESKGTLTGIVSDSVTLSPIAGVAIQATASPTRGYQTTTGADGAYTMLLPIGTYTITASIYGYQPATVGPVAVFSGTTMSQDLNLTPRPWPTWEKAVYFNDVLTDTFPVTIAPSDTIEIVDQVWITYTNNVTFTLTEEWSESLDLLAYQVRALPGGTVVIPGYGTVVSAPGRLVVEITDAPSDWGYVITKTFTVLNVSGGTDVITETLWVEDTAPQFVPIVLQFVSQSKLYLPLVMRNY
ncbi:MAG: carboxypeptidase-like regulatory domain-containing protein [Anaerolineae bacterium]